MIGLGTGNSLSLAASRPLKPPFVGVLDGFTAGLTLALDLKRRLLSSYTGGAFLARADRTGQPTMEIPFLSNGTWDTAALLEFSAGDDVYVVTPLNQCGSGIVITQGNASAQPRIVTAGVIETNGAVFNNVTTQWVASLSDILDLVGSNQAQIYSDFLPLNDQTSAQIMLAGPQGMRAFIPFVPYGTVDFDWTSGSGRASASTPSGLLGTASKLSLEKDVTTSSIRINGSVVASAASTGVITSGAFSFELPNAKNLSGNIASYIVWRTCDATLAAGRVAALV